MPQRRKCHGLCSAVIGYVSVSEEANTKPVERFGEHALLYDWRDPANSIKDKIDLVWQNIGTGMNE